MPFIVLIVAADNAVLLKAFLKFICLCKKTSAGRKHGTPARSTLICPVRRNVGGMYSRRRMCTPFLF